jgi:type II secretory pathway component GspD/PulD (secretin)
MFNESKRLNLLNSLIITVMAMFIFESVLYAQPGMDLRREALTVQQRLRVAVTYSCESLPIDTVLLQLAELGNVDIVKSPKVTGNVTIKVTNVPLDEVLENILSAHDYTYIATNYMIRVVPLPEAVAYRDKMVSRIYHITYADVAGVSDALGQFISDKGKISYNKGTNHIIVTDTEDKIRAIDSFIGQVDQMTQQVVVEVRLYDVETNEAFDLTVDWDIDYNKPKLEYPRSERTTSTTTTNTNEYTNTYAKNKNGGYTSDSTYEENSNGGYTSDSESHTDYGETSNGQSWTDEVIGWEENEVGVIVPVYGPGASSHTHEDMTGWSDGTTHEDGTNWNDTTGTKHKEGTNWGNTTGENVYGPTSGTTTTVTDTPINNHLPILKRKRLSYGASFNPSTGGTIRFGFLDNNIDLQFALSMLHSDLQSKLLANPRIMVLDHQPANFEIVREVPYTELSQTSAGGNMTSTRFMPVGVKLNVTPHIARDGLIRLEIEPEFSTIVSLDINGAPTMDTRRAKTTAMVRDGETIVLGGLRKKSTSKGVDKFPLLGDIPIVGGLFRNEHESEVTSELILFITSKIVTRPCLKPNEVQRLKQTVFSDPELCELEFMQRDEEDYCERDKGKCQLRKSKGCRIQRAEPEQTYRRTHEVRSPQVTPIYPESSNNTLVDEVPAYNLTRQVTITEPVEMDFDQPKEAPVDSREFIKQWMKRAKENSL